MHGFRFRIRLPGFESAGRVSGSDSFPAGADPNTHAADDIGRRGKIRPFGMPGYGIAFSQYGTAQNKAVLRRKFCTCLGHGHISVRLAGESIGAEGGRLRLFLRSAADPLRLERRIGIASPEPAVAAVRCGAVLAVSFFVPVRLRLRVSFGNAFPPVKNGRTGEAARSGPCARKIAGTELFATSEPAENR